MPQMFPLFWSYLFISTAIALFMMMTCIHFAAKKNQDFPSTSVSNASNDHNWKW